MIATKASRVVEAAKGKSVIEFGLRREPGIDAGMKNGKVLGLHCRLPGHQQRPRWHGIWYSSLWHHGAFIYYVLSQRN